MQLIEVRQVDEELVVEVHEVAVVAMTADMVVVAAIPAVSILVKKMKCYVGVQSQQSSGQCKRRGQIREESFIVVLNSRLNSVVTSSGQRMLRTQVVEEVVVVLEVLLEALEAKLLTVIVDSLLPEEQYKKKEGIKEGSFYAVLNLEKISADTFSG